VQLDFTEKATTATAWWHTTDKLIPVYCFQPKHFPSRLLTNLVKPVTQKSWLYSTCKRKCEWAQSTGLRQLGNWTKILNAICENTQIRILRESESCWNSFSALTPLCFNFNTASSLWYHWRPPRHIGSVLE